MITLTLSGIAVVSNGTSGYLTIGTGVMSVSTSSAFPGGTYNVTSAQAPILTSVSVSVNKLGNTFSTVGSQITLTFSTNESVVNPTVTLLGHTIGVSGTGPGPYTVNYTLVSGDAQGTVNATIMFTDTNGNSGSATVNVLSNGSGSTAKHERIHYFEREFFGRAVFRQFDHVHPRSLHARTECPVGDGIL